MTNQPEWECIGQLGDASPLEYGGLWVFRDKTGVYPEEAEYLICPEDDEERGRHYIAYRFILERCHWTPKFFDMGVLSDNKFHLDHPAWFATPEGQKKDRPQDNGYLSNICSFADIEFDELIRMFCSGNALERAEAYRLVGQYHGFDNLDSYPLELTKTDMKQRYATRSGKLKPKYRTPK